MALAPDPGPTQGWGQSHSCDLPPIYAHFPSPPLLLGLALTLLLPMAQSSSSSSSMAALASAQGPRWSCFHCCCYQAKLEEAKMCSMLLAGMGQNPEQNKQWGEGVGNGTGRGNRGCGEGD